MKKYISIALSILCFTLSLYASDISKQNNTIIHFNHVFFKKLSDSKTLCYAVAQTDTGNKAIKTIVESPQWQHVETFKKQNIQFIGKLGTDKVIALANGAIYGTMRINDQIAWNNTKPILTQKNKESIILDIVGRSIDEFWIILYNIQAQTAKVGFASKNTTTGSYSVKPTDYTWVSVTPDNSYAWFIKPQSKDDSGLILSIEELEKKEKSTTAANDEDDIFEETSINIDTMLPRNIKKLVAMNASIAYAIDHGGKLYMLDYQGTMNTIDTGAIGAIDTIALLGNKLIVTSGNTIYRYENKQFVPLLTNNVIRTEEPTISEKKPEQPLEAEKEVSAAPIKQTEAAPIIEPITVPEPIITKVPTEEPTVTVLPEQTLSLPQPIISEETTISTQKSLPIPENELDTGKKALNMEATPVPVKIEPKKNYYDPLIEDKPEYVPTEQELLQEITKPASSSTVPQSPQNSSYWDLLKKSAAVARVKAQGAWQNYGQKASGWFKGWYTQK